MSHSPPRRFCRPHRGRRSRLRTWRRDGPHKIRPVRRCRIERVRRWRSADLTHSPRVTTRDRGVALGLSLALLTLPFLASCDRTSVSPAPARPTPAAPPPPKPQRAITFQGLDYDYRGSTAILPDDRMTHQKEPP